MTDYSTRYLVPTFNGLVAQIGLSAGISVVCVGIFEWNRRKKTLQYLYSPRCRLKVNPSPPMSLKFLGWINPTINIPEEFYIANVGLDAVMFLRFLKMCLQFCVFNAIVVGAILLPIHYTASRQASEVPRMSISNVPDDSNVLWAHVFLTYMVTISWMFLLFKNYWQWMDLRREYTLQRIRQGEIAERSIFISRLPSNLRSDAALKQYFESLKMGPVETATVVQHCGRLSQKIDRRESALNMLEKAHIELARSVLESIKHGKFMYSAPTIPTMDQSLLQPLKRESLVIQSIDATALENITQDLFADKKRFNKVRKSIFAHKRQPSQSLPQPQLNIPLSALSHHSDIIDIYVNGQEDIDPMGSCLSLSPPPFTIWNVLALLDRHAFDKYQPTRPEKRFKTGDRVESIEYFVKKYNKLDRKVGELRDGSLRYKSTSFGFVTFKHHLSAQLCAQAKIDSRPQGLSVRPAMEPRDVLWSNLTSSFRNRFTRSVVVNLSIWVLIIFWIFPTSSFLLLTSLGALSARFTFLKPVLEASPLIQSLLQNVLPIVFVTIFLALAPVIILEISKQELPVSHSALEGNVFRRYYHFLIFNVLFVFMIGTAILKSIITLIQQPTNIFTLLAASLPAGSTFFIFYIVFNTCTHSLELVQVWAQLVIHSFVTARKLTPTPRALQRATTPWCFQYYYYYPQNILALVITFIYSVISPLILVAAVPYFAFALLVFKYQFAYCYIRKYENSGKFFRHVFQYTTDGLLIFQITMIGVLWLKQALVGGFFIVALLGFTAYFKILCGDLFKSRTKFLPLDTGLRNFDNESSFAMNEIPTPNGGNSARSSVYMDSGIRRRNGGGVEQFNEKSQEQDLKLDGGKSTALSGGGIAESATTDSDYARPFTTLRQSSQSDRYEKLAPDEKDDKMETESTRPGVGTADSDKRRVDQEETMSASRGYNSGSTGLGLSVSRMINNPSRQSLSLKIHTRDDIEPSPLSNDSSTNEIQLFTVEDGMPLSSKPAEAGKEDAMDGDLEGEDVRYSGGFLDEDGFYLENFGVRNSGMSCQPLASHFEHTPSKLTYQDRTSDFETYIHPALLKPLNRKMWLPKNPLYEHWDLDDTVEIDFSLNSSATAEKLEFRVQENEDETVLQHHKMLQSPRLSKEHHPSLPRRNTIVSNFDNGGGVHSLSSPSNWEGCLSDSPPAGPTSTTRAAASQWERQYAGVGGRRFTSDEVVGTPSIAARRSQSGDRTTATVEDISRQQQGGFSPISLRSTPMSHSASLSSIRIFSPTSPKSSSQFSPTLGQEEHLVSIGGPVTNTRFKRSVSMPPAPLLSEGNTELFPTTSSPTTLNTTVPSPFLSIRQPIHHNRSNVVLPSTSPTQSPRVSFVHDTSSGNAANSTASPLTVRSTMFAGPIMHHRHTISHHQGHSLTGAGQASSRSGGIREMAFYPAGPMGMQGNSAGTAGPVNSTMTQAGPSTATSTEPANNAPGAATAATVPLMASPPPVPAPARKPQSRGTAGAFFNMIFGDPEDDVLEANENPRFGYETGGMWAMRRGSIDRHDDDDDDDDDEEDGRVDEKEVKESFLSRLGGSGGRPVVPATPLTGRQQLGRQAQHHRHQRETIIDVPSPTMALSPRISTFGSAAPSASGSANVSAATSPTIEASSLTGTSRRTGVSLGGLQLAQPSHLDLADMDPVQRPPKST